MAISIDEGGSNDLAFRDTAGRRLAVSLLGFDLREWGSTRPHQVAFDLEGEERFVPVGGRDEPALLGFLERWARSAGVGEVFFERDRRYARREIDLPSFEQGRGDSAYYEVIGLSVLPQLRNR